MGNSMTLGTRQNKLIAIILFVTMFIMTMIPFSSAFAQTGGVNLPQGNVSSNVGTFTFPATDAPKIESAIGKMRYNTVDAGAGKEVTQSPIFTMSGNTVLVNFEELGNGSTASQRKVLGDFVQQLNASGASSDTKSNLMNQISAHDDSVNKLMIPIIMDATSADLYEASKIVNPFLPIVRVIFGILTIVISVLLIGSTIIDLIFIGFPLAREAFSKDKGGGGGRIPWVTSEAQSVIAETEGGGGSGGDYKNPYFLYLKRRIVSYIVLAFCLLWLVVGELGGFIGWLMTLGEGLIES